MGKRIGTAGHVRDNDARITVKLGVEDRKVEIHSKLKEQFAPLMETAVLSALEELAIDKAHVLVEDQGALDFTLRARTKTAIKRAVHHG
jgi:citrate lyase subunit gamma (acyl carrier protein)